jgi:hypothetical protein
MSVSPSAHSWPAILRVDWSSALELDDDRLLG